MQHPGVLGDSSTLFRLAAAADGRLLADIFLLNRLDVVSISVLTAHLTDMIGENESVNG